MVLLKIIENKILKYKDLRYQSNRLNHVFFSILNNNKIFINDVERILGLMIFNSCQDALNAIRIGNLNLYDYYLSKINYYSGEIKYTKLEGINAIIYPMKAYKYYFEKSFNNAIDEIQVAIKSLINISEELGENALPPILEQYKNLVLIHLKNKNTAEGLNIIEYLLNGFIVKKSVYEYLFPIEIKENTLKKYFFNNIIDEILLKQYELDSEVFKVFFQNVIEIMSLSSIYKSESVILTKFLLEKCTMNDVFFVIQSELPSIVEGNIHRAYINHLDKSEKQIILEYFKNNYNFTL